MRLLWFGSQRSKDIFRESVLQSLYLPVLNSNSTARQESWGDVSFWARVLPAQRVPFLMATDGSSGTLACLFFLTVGSTSITKCFTKGKKVYQFSPVVGVSIAQESMYFCSLLHKRPVTRRLLQTYLFIPRQQSCFQSELSFVPPCSHKIFRTGSPCRLHFVLDLWSFFTILSYKATNCLGKKSCFPQHWLLHRSSFQYHSWKPGYAKNQTVDMLTCTCMQNFWFCILWIKLKAATEKQHKKKK